MAKSEGDDNQEAQENAKPPAASSRREFLTGMGAINAARERIEKLPDVNDWTPKDFDVDGLWEQYSKSAMACQFEISFNLHQYRQASGATMLAFQLIDDLEEQLTVYREDSEVSQLNRLKVGEQCKVESRLFDLLRLAKTIHKDTGGAFDITAGPLSKIWGFEARNGKLPSDAKIKETLAVVDSRLLNLDESEQCISFEREGVKINLGGIGKGYALDRVAELLSEKGINDFAIHGGQSSVLARGDGGPHAGSGWPVGISHPTAAGARLGQIQLKDMALGTSGTGRQGFFHRGKRYGHIIDPRTGWPSDHHLSTTVVSKSAAVSDALATAFFTMDIADVETYCSEHADIKTLLVQSVGKSSGRVRVIALNFDESEVEIFE